MATNNPAGREKRKRGKKRGKEKGRKRKPR